MVNHSIEGGVIMKKKSRRPGRTVLTREQAVSALDSKEGFVAMASLLEKASDIVSGLRLGSRIKL